jgi:hypothetical protein
MPACRQEEVSVASNEPSREMLEQLLGRELRRRDFLRWSAAVATSAGLASFLAACNPAASTTAPSVAASVAPVATPAGSVAAAATPSAAATFGRTVKIGYVSPKTGPLAPFAEADDFILNGIQQTVGAGLLIGGITHPIQVVTKDAQSDSNVADQCEANGVPCISSVAPWQPYYLGRQKDAANPKPFAWSYHFFSGLKDIIAVFLDMWGQDSTNKSIGTSGWVISTRPT